MTQVRKPAETTDRRGPFTRFAARTADACGRAAAFVIALAMIAAWLASGPLFGFSDTWQLVINTTTTIVTFLMVFLIQNSQNRDARAVHLKLDELLRAVKGARTELCDLEELSDEELSQLHEEFRALHAKVASHVERRAQGAARSAGSGGSTAERRDGREEDEDRR